MKEYDKHFYENFKDVSKSSSEAIVPLLIEYFKPNSVVDVGCGLGVWLKTFQNNGLNDFIGIDGPHVDTNNILIPKNRFIQQDLSKPIPSNITDKNFNLAISLEVAEHIEEAYSDVFVSSLINLAPVVVFSAAIPFQGGTNHVNERWPTYWAEKFNRHGYKTLDIIRPRIWEDNTIAHYYRQNILVFVSSTILSDNPLLAKFLHNPDDNSLIKIHPCLWEEKNRTVKNQSVLSHIKIILRKMNFF